MWLRRLSLTDFRSYGDADLSMSPGVTTFVGPNGHGKTNLLEAVAYLATFASHRVSTDAALVRRGAERAYVRGLVGREDRDVLLEVELNPGRTNRVRLNRAPVPRPRDALGVLRTVLFAPEDLAVVKGDPAERRRFLDELLVARSPRLAGVRADFERVLRQRNALLKSLAGRRASSEEAPTLESWDLHLARTSAELITARRALTAELRPWVDESYRAVSGRATPIGVGYQCSVAADGEALGTEELTARLLERIAELRGQELARGLTLVGPHRDELTLEVSALPARGYASHGESWSLALALRLAAYRLLAADPAGVPVLLLDDVFAELDSDRRARLAELVGDAEQVLITAAALEDVPLPLHGGRFDVHAGEVRHVA